ncbi:flagellar basal-body MS-ring/collar protein FliF [Novosphingobium sp. KCTC 2891]|uniref:flagellar basal-body MS-ring/collar protein FliF n=1 Tax=Novosphingobium sp. KCTC 2891 TaxID=2989730 RepID=UPI0022229D9B|nr:flagellar basal-body MS-ring/collar protein FliF [Novosphingobium sp. KCTC 2891]MCW1383007.1 flagellar basal-body MS-ring/collar protein FliF [Novosphingobium sp. KCTC 2891]
MADLVPASPAGFPAGSSPSLLAPFTDPSGGPALARIGAFMRQPPVRRAVPWFAGVSAAGMTGLLWLTMAPAPQRVLYSDLSDSERAGVVAALDKAAIPYTIDNSTGALSVGENDLYKARMVAASDGALATPETGQQMIDKLPMGASRTVEGQRLQAARERELELTVMEIDGVEAVRVHLAEPEKSVFVRESAAPSASVMVKLAKGRQLSDSQVAAILNLVAASVPGLAVDAVRVIDQHGRLLSADKPGENDRLEMQGRLEEKLRQQVAALLTPMLGDGNFSSEIQVELDMDQTTSARESYDKQGAVRQESQSASQSSGAAGAAAGVPGVLSNTPPPPTTTQPGAPGAPPAPGAAPAPGASPAPTAGNGETSSTRTYELGREVAVVNASPGKIKRLSVAVALSGEIMAKAKPAEIEQIKQLVSAAVGADTTRGDQVAVAVRSFRPMVVEPPKFWETPWFATILRNAVALLAVLLTLLLGVRPLIKALRRDPSAPAASKKARAGAADDDDDDDEAGDDDEEDAPPRAKARKQLPPVADPATGEIDAAALSRQVGFAQKLVSERPDSAVEALRQMLKEPEVEGAR